MIKPLKFKLREGGFAVLEIIVVLVVLGLIGATGFIIYQRNNGSSLSLIGKSGNAEEGCTVTDGINFCAHASSASVSPSDNLSIKTSLKNQTSKTYTTAEIYSSSCNAPSVTINGKEVPDIELCTQDITSVSIGAGDTKTYEITIDTANLKEGNNTIILKWNGDKLVSKPIPIELKTKTKADNDKSISCIGEQKAQSYCARVLITLKKGTYKEQGGTTCDDVDDYLKPLGLKAERKYCDLIDMGILSVYVPKVDADNWVLKIKQLPQINSADIEY